MRYLLSQNALGPPPPTVGHSPQLSTTVSGTVAACPAVRRVTVNVACGVPGASATVKPPPPLWPPASMRAFVAAPTSSWRTVPRWRHPPPHHVTNGHLPQPRQ